MDKLKVHGVREFHSNTSDDDFCAEEIRNLGYTVIESGLSDPQLQSIREKMDSIYKQQLAEIGGEEKLEKIKDANVGRCLLGYDDYFVELAAHPRIISITTKLLGEYFILMSQNAIVNSPSDEHYQVTWHRDLNYQHFVSSRPLAVSALYAIDEFSEASGATHLLPASHKSEQFPSNEYVGRHETTVSAPAGSIILFDAMVFHRTGVNSSGQPRRAVNHIYTLPLIRQQISFPRMLRGKFKEDPFLRRLLGYDIETADSVTEWRQNKLRL
jgi:ectoine hydroxylase-related dioxygenase (phytanoyl-CoA dioxygenase family)